MIESALACGQCGAGLRTSDSTDGGACVQCGPEQRDVLTNTGEVPNHVPSDRMSWHDGEDAARIPLTEHAVLDLLRQHFSDVDSIFVHPYVPSTKEHAARLAHAAHIPRHEPILALYETHLLDASIHEGFVVTPSRVCWKNRGEASRSIAWSDLDPEQLYLDGLRLFLGEAAITLAEPEIQDACANAFHVLALSGLPPRPIASGRVLVRDTRPDLADASESDPGSQQGPGDSDHSGLQISIRRSATPPPPHTTSYFAYASHAQTQAPDCTCWHCHTPLYATTPQCSFCGVEPKPTGWLRTA